MQLFICSSREDFELHHAIQEHLVEHGISVWLDDMRTHETIHEQTARWFAESDLVVLLLTQDYVHSRYFTEIEWPTVQETKTPVLLLDFCGRIPEEPSKNIDIRQCRDKKLAPQIVLDYIRERKQKRIFVSYSRQDESSALSLVENLERSLNRIWIDKSGLTYGEQFPDQILDEIAASDHVVLLWSRHSRRSRWVEKEWNYAYKIGKSVLPILLDNTPLPMALEDTHAFSSLSDKALYEFFDVRSPRITSKSPLMRFLKSIRNKSVDDC